MTEHQRKEAPGRNFSSLWCLVYMLGEVAKQNVAWAWVTGGLSSTLVLASPYHECAQGRKEDTDFWNVLPMSLGGWPQKQVL